MNQIIGAFDNFDPLKDELPLPYIFSLGYQYQRAMLILDVSLNKTDLNIVLEAIAEMRRLGEDEAINPTPNRDTDVAWHAHSETLKVYLGHQQLTKLTSSQGAKIEWSSVFAIAALASIANFMDLDSQSPGSPQEAVVITSIKNDLPLEAMEAAAYAEALKPKEVTRAKRSKSVSKKRLESSHDLKLEIVTTFNQLPSNIPVRQAAFRIIEQMSEQSKMRFTCENSLVQVQVWLGQYKKGTLPGSDKLPPYKPIV
jgi:hypothetical protein